MNTDGHKLRNLVNEVLVLSYEEQIAALRLMPPNWATFSDKRVAHGAPWTPHEYVVHMLDTIFLPSKWSFETDRIEIVNMPNGEAMIFSRGTLTVTFADGSIVRRSNTGAAPVRVLTGANALDKTPSDNWETAIKAADTDALKGCAGDLGRIFRPVMKQELVKAITQDFFGNELRNQLRPAQPDPKLLERNRSVLGRDDGDLAAEPEEPRQPEPEKKADAGELPKDGKAFFEWCNAHKISPRDAGQILGETPAAYAMHHGGYEKAALFILNNTPELTKKSYQPEAANGDH